MSLYLLDTNIVSDLIKNPHGRVAAKIAELGENAIVTSVVVAAELRFGATKRGLPRLSAQVEAILGAINILPLQPPVDTHYGQIRAELEQKGRMIGGNDLLIAAHALTFGYVLVTANVTEFERVNGLMLENWLVQED